MNNKIQKLYERVVKEAAIKPGSKYKGNLPGIGPVDGRIEEVDGNDALLSFYSRGEDREEWYSISFLQRYSR